MSVMQYRVGLGNASSYQVSGKPWAQGGINATQATSVSFPECTRWVQIVNNTSNDLKVGFSNFGVEGSNYFTVAGDGKSDRLELKLTELHLSGSSNVDVVAGLTFIDASSIDNAGVSPETPFINWSGSAGVG